MTAKRPLGRSPFIPLTFFLLYDRRKTAGLLHVRACILSKPSQEDFSDGRLTQGNTVGGEHDSAGMFPSQDLIMLFLPKPAKTDFSKGIGYHT
jgi:hypothetical protein